MFYLSFLQCDALAEWKTVYMQEYKRLEVFQIFIKTHLKFMYSKISALPYTGLKMKEFFEADSFEVYVL